MRAKGGWIVADPVHARARRRTQSPDLARTCKSCVPSSRRAISSRAPGVTGWSTSLQPADLSVEKIAYSAFYMTRLEWILRKCDIRRLIVGGIVTNGGVASTLRDAHVRDFEATVLEDGCAAFSPEVHQVAIEALRPVAASRRSPKRWKRSVAHERALGRGRRLRGGGADRHRRRGRGRARSGARGARGRRRSPRDRARCHTARLDRAFGRADPGGRHALATGERDRG